MLLIEEIDSESDVIVAGMIYWVSLFKTRCYVLVERVDGALSRAGVGIVRIRVDGCDGAEI